LCRTYDGQETELDGTFTRLARGIGLRTDGSLVHFYDVHPRLEPLEGGDFAEISAVRIICAEYETTARFAAAARACVDGG
jgi:hypothetical protein